MTDVEEKLIIERCKRGEQAAFDILIRAYEKRVYNLAYRLSGSYDDANDISVDAFIRIYQAIRLFRGEANFSTWLYRIVTNIYLDRRKRARNKQHLSLEEYIELEENSVARQIESPDPTPDRGGGGPRAQRHACKATINTLPDYQRAMIVLYHTEGKSYEEIAAIHGVAARHGEIAAESGAVWYCAKNFSR